MFTRRSMFVWLGILMLSGMFLLGQDAWEACVDADGDTFPDVACGGTDCDDTNADIYPAVLCPVPGQPWSVRVPMIWHRPHPHL